MRIPLLFTAISVVYAQGKFSDVLDNPNLSSLKILLQQYPSFAESISNGSYGKSTFLAPSNDAINKFKNKTNSTMSTENDMELLLSYHLLNGSYSSTQLNSTGGVTAKSFLTAPQYNNLNSSGGNVVFASRYGSSGTNTTASALEIYTGDGESSTVDTTDLTYDYGYVHIVDDVLDLPQSCTDSLKTLQLSSLVTALNNANLSDTLNSKPAVTCFAPTQEAFIDAQNPETQLPPDSLKIALFRHTLTTAVYTPDLKEGTTYPTLENNQSITVEREGGYLYIKTAQGKARVVQGNVIVNNGVIHVIDKVLPPDSPPSGSPTASGSSPSASSSGGTSAASFVAPSAYLFTATVAIALAIVQI